MTYKPYNTYWLVAMLGIALMLGIAILVLNLLWR